MNKKQQEEMQMPNQFELSLDEARYILLYTEINWESAKEINTKLLGMALENKKKPIYLEINSPGGNVNDGIAIINTIQNLPCAVISVINGMAASMAGFISVVADHRIITANSYWMGHAGSDGVCGNTDTILDRGIFLKRLDDNLNKIFKERTKINDEDFAKILKGELWLDPEDCLKKGIVDEILKTPTRRITKKERKK